MNKNLFTRVELMFWNFAIRMLSSFRLARVTLSRNGQLLDSSEAGLLWALVGIAGVAGLVSGYLFYFLTAGLR